MQTLPLESVTLKTFVSPLSSGLYGAVVGETAVAVVPVEEMIVPVGVMTVLVEEKIVSVEEIILSVVIVGEPSKVVAVLSDVDETS